MKDSDYLQIDEPYVPTGSVKVMTVRNISRKGGLEAVSSHKRALEACGVEDSRDSSSRKFIERFTEKGERRRKYEQMLELKYDGSALDYHTWLDSMIGVAGEPFRAIVEVQMTLEMKRTIFQKYRRIPEKSVILFEALEETGLTEERTRRFGNNAKGPQKAKTSRSDQGLRDKDRPITDAHARVQG